jgi:hypothetical protein
MQKQRTEAQITDDKRRIKGWLKNLMPDHYDKFDVEAHFDSSLTYDENKSAIREKVKLFVEKDLKDVIKEEKANQEKEKHQQENLQKDRDMKIEAEIQEHNTKLVPVNTNLDQYYVDIDRAVQKVVQGFSNLCFVKGRGGIGKSYNIRKNLVNSKAEFVEINGDVTEAYLYRLFFENNGKILWFKDVAKLLMGLKSINLLKSATETDAVRILTKSNYSKQQEDLPPRFMWDGRIIFDYNSLQGLSLKDDFEALVTRGDYVEFSLSIDDIKEIMQYIAKTPEEKEVTDFVVKEYVYSGYDLLNLRSQVKAIQTRKYAEMNGFDWHQEVKSELVNNQSRTKKFLYGLIGKKAIRTVELKKMLIRSGHIQTLRTADRMINEWLVLEEIYPWSEEKYNFYVALRPKT